MFITQCTIQVYAVVVPHGVHHIFGPVCPLLCAFALQILGVAHHQSYVMIHLCLILMCSCFRWCSLQSICPLAHSNSSLRKRRKITRHSRLVWLETRHLYQSLKNRIICNIESFVILGMTGFIHVVSFWENKCRFGPQLSSSVPNTVQCCYNAVQYNEILYTSLQELRQNISQGLPPQDTHISP